ncbi:MAG: F0F1 ATP synthase subunit epsilon, partial [Hyphomicrobium sp.]
GVLDVTAGGSRRRVLVKSGFAEVDPSRLTILAQSAYDIDELTPAIIAKEMSAAEADLANAKDDAARAAADALIGELRRLGPKAA